MVKIFDQLIVRGAFHIPKSQNKKRRISPLDEETRRPLMYLISEKLAQMRRANIAKISLLIFFIEPSIWRLRQGSGKVLQRAFPGKPGRALLAFGSSSLAPVIPVPDQVRDKLAGISVASLAAPRDDP